MVANITTGKDVYGALAYNQEKVDRGDGKVLLTHIVREPTDGRFNVAATAEDLLRWMPSHYRTEKPVVHVSLNPAPEDRLDDGQLAEIAGAYMERMVGEDNLISYSSIPTSDGSISISCRCRWPRTGAR